MAFGATITYGGVTINPAVISDVGYRIHSIKQTLGKRLATAPTIGSSQSQDRAFTITGRFSDSNRFTSKASLLALDDGKQHVLVDGEHDGDYVILPDTLRFTHDSSRPVDIPFVFSVLEW